MKNIKNIKTGFTLVETIVAVAIFTILAFGVTALFQNIFISSRNRIIAIDNVDQARLTANNFTNEIRVASIGNAGDYPINQASGTQIIFYSNYGQVPGIIARIRYYLSDSTLYKGVVIPEGNPLSYNLANEQIRNIQNNIINSGQSIFYYYDGNYNGSSSPLSEPININQIKYVSIDFNVLKQSVNTSTSTFNISAGASIRNLKINLGN